ncbi:MULTISPECIES: hypothetical protein [Acinetobacter]|uniref:hypothetical protein n=1 Tax=Acinetobacter TaxID=469 RepID=UPI000CFE466D|nr:hypothetical protein [Acinetobacter sp. MYb10]QLD63428.1 hypothetical protein CQZ96_020090 [Acinetobacter sp. MYb10]
MKAQAIRIPDLAREVCPLENIGYEDAFSIDIPTLMMTKKYSAEKWAYEIFANAPPAINQIVSQSWNTLGFKSKSESHWQSLESATMIKQDDLIMMVVHSDSVDIQICMVINLIESQLIFSSFFSRGHKWFSTPTLKMMTVPHRFIAPYLLNTAAERMKLKSYIFIV